MKTVFIHPERCIGCKQCEFACALAHSQTKNPFLAVFERPAPKSRIHTEPGLDLNTSLPNKCRHCDPAPCQGACPTGAIHRAANQQEIVLIEARKCIRCGMCAMVCPFDVISFHASYAAPERTDVALKCDHCIERQRLGLTPACVEACKTGALEFGEINDLTKAARVRYSRLILQTVGIETILPAHEETPLIPANIGLWRHLGASIGSLNANGGSNGKKGA